MRKSLHPGDWRRPAPEVEEPEVEEDFEAEANPILSEVPIFNPEAGAIGGNPFPEMEAEPEVEEEPEVDYESMTVAQLRDLLNERGLPVSGVKAELIARLEEDDAGPSEEAPAESEEAPSEEAASSEEEVSEYGENEEE